MKSFVALALFCLCTFVPASDPQTKPKKNQAIPYSDADGYQVLSSCHRCKNREADGRVRLDFSSNRF
jgi:hypothetical protein